MNTPLTPLRRKLLLLAAVSCLPVQGAEFAFDLLPEVENQQLGANFAAAGDVDGDGTADVAIADPGYKANGFLASGVVFIMSGADGSHLRTYLPESSASSQYFGIALASLDANGDGTTDLAVGSPGYTGSTGYGTGTVRVFSGTDGALLSVAYGLAGFQFGGAITNAGDQNGDGCEDLYVGASMAYGNRGAVFVQSGLDGTILRTVQADITFTTFATSLATVGDIDGDGKADVAVGAPGYRVSSNYLGRVLLIRSSDGVTATQLVGTGTGPRFGYTLASVPDANGDGIGDLMAGTYSGGVALLLSGADLTTIRDLSVTGLPNFQAVNVGGALDFDDDGLEDYLIGSPALNLATVLFTPRMLTVASMMEFTTLSTSSVKPSPSVSEGGGGTSSWITFQKWPMPRPPVCVSVSELSPKAKPKPFSGFMP